MNAHDLTLETLPGHYGVFRLAPDAAVPAWILAADGFLSITRTKDELSIVCAEDSVPPWAKAERGFRILKVQGILDFFLTGILATIAVPLAEANISIFAVSTHDTDYVLVAANRLEDAIHALTAAGHKVQP